MVLFFRKKRAANLPPDSKSIFCPHCAMIHIDDDFIADEVDHNMVFNVSENTVLYVA